MTQTRFFPWLFSITIVGFLIVGGALAQEEESSFAEMPELIEVHKDWRVYRYGSGAGEICYIFSEPVAKHPKGVQRGSVFFSVTHRSTNVRNEVSMRAGYKFSPKSKPFVAINGKKFSFYTGVTEGEDRAHWAWMRSAEDEAALIEAMKRGTEMTIKGTSSRGTLTTDRYSLLGVSKALQSIDKECE